MLSDVYERKVSIKVNGGFPFATSDVELQPRFSKPSELLTRFGIFKNLLNTNVVWVLNISHYLCVIVRPLAQTARCAVVDLFLKEFDCLFFLLSFLAVQLVILLTQLDCHLQNEGYPTNSPFHDSLNFPGL